MRLNVQTKIEHEGKIRELTDDLMTVLESHIDELGSDVMFYTCIKFMTIGLYDNMSSHDQAMKVLKLSIEDGMRTAGAKENPR